MDNAIDLPVNGFPTLRELFDEFDSLLFDSALKQWSIEWSARMKTSAGLCEPRKRSIRISSVIHQYRSLKELRETILHEMIHAQLYQQGVRHESAHGPSFQKAAQILGEACQLNITTYHHFFEEVQEARTSYIWRCNFCGFEKHGRTKPASKKHNGNCTGQLIRLTHHRGQGATPLVGHIIRPVREIPKHLYIGKGTVLGRAEPKGEVDRRAVSRETLKMQWVQSFDLDEAVLNTAPPPEPLVRPRASSCSSSGRECGNENTPVSRRILFEEVTLEQSMLSKGVLVSAPESLSRQTHLWDDY